MNRAETDFLNDLYAGANLTVRVRSIKDRPEARYVTVEFQGAIATFRFKKEDIYPPPDPEELI